MNAQIQRLTNEGKAKVRELILGGTDIYLRQPKDEGGEPEILLTDEVLDLWVEGVEELRAMEDIQCLRIDKWISITRCTEEYPLPDELWDSNT